MSAEPNSAAEAMHEEEALGKAYDTRQLLRLWPYVRPYGGQVALTLLLIVPIFIVEVAPAWIIKTGLNSVISGDTEAVGRVTSLDRLLAPVSGLLTPPAGIASLWWLAGLFLLFMLLMFLSPPLSV
ncbi:MAG: hypothetical protein QF391_15890 [Myxococcota bacterium]|nr:hypothetical protein [Myxococcota bacterium]